MESPKPELTHIGERIRTALERELELTAQLRAARGILLERVAVRNMAGRDRSAHPLTEPQFDESARPAKTSARRIPVVARIPPQVAFGWRNAPAFHPSWSQPSSRAQIQALRGCSSALPAVASGFQSTRWPP